MNEWDLQVRQDESPRQEARNLTPIRSKSLLLLTATVAPMVAVARADPQIRLSDYLGMLDQWWHCIKVRPFDVLFCENSGYDLEPIHARIRELGAEFRIKVIQFTGDRHLIERNGKGSGEAEIFDYCLQHAQLQRYEYIAKCTGRLFVQNAHEILENALATKPDVMIAIRSDLDFADTRFFVIRSKVFKEHLLHLGEEIEEEKGVYIEHIVLKRLFRAMADGVKWVPFAKLPRYIGVGGTDGKRHTSLMGRVRYSIKSSMHSLAQRFAIFLYL